MDNGHAGGVRPPSYLRVHERAIAVLTLATEAVHLAPPRQTLVRKWRARSGGQPSPLERLMGLVIELHRAGVSVATLRGIPQALHDLLDDLTVGLARPRLTMDALLRENALEHVENTAALRVASTTLADARGDAEEARALRDFIAAIEAENHHQHEMKRAAQARLRDIQRTAARTA